MNKLILVTGGSRSGKSSFAESLAGKIDDSVLYIATSIPFDDEMKARVEKHRKQRPKEWKTLEAYKDFDIRLKEAGACNKVFLLDCITLMVSNIILENSIDWDSSSNEQISEIEQTVVLEVEKLLKSVKDLNVSFIGVTNEVGMGIVPENRLSRVFRDIAGRINQLLAKAADEVYLCVSGIPVRIK
ncbi:MAG: bifunctional adenosylcobinamide kinase/adenosylcobinamide-phosphate guanylyltransferase [Bacillota bacterium]